jgi:hypothetical protein
MSDSVSGTVMLNVDYRIYNQQAPWRREVPKTKVEMDKQPEGSGTTDATEVTKDRADTQHLVGFLKEILQT